MGKRKHQPLFFSFARHGATPTPTTPTANGISGMLSCSFALSLPVVSGSRPFSFSSQAPCLSLQAQPSSKGRGSSWREDQRRPFAKKTYRARKPKNRSRERERARKSSRKKMSFFHPSIPLSSSSSSFSFLFLSLFPLSLSPPPRQVTKKRRNE